MGKIIGVNLLILLIYSMIIRIPNRDDYNISGVMLMAFIIVMHFMSNVIAAFVYEDKEKRPYFGISAFLILLVGFATCTVPLNF